MEDIVRDTLKKLIAQYGIQLCYEPQKIEGFLRDYCGQYKREINVLTIAARQRVPEELLKLSDTSMDALVVHRLVQRLHEDVGVDKELALWAVNTWAVALGRADSDIASSVHIKEDTTASATGVDDEFTLKEAVKNARSGETIRLPAGIYTLTNALNIDKSLSIKGEGMDKTRVIGIAGDCVIRLEGSCEWNIQDVAFEYCGTEDEANVLVASDGVVDIRRCSFTGAKGRAGLMLEGNVTGAVMECNISGNDAGINVCGKAHPLLEGNSCQGNSLDGIQYCEQAVGTARNNKCTDNKQHGIAVFGEAQPILEGNCCWGNSYFGIAYSEQATGTARNNECTNNKQSGIAVFGEARPVLEGNTCQGNIYCGIAYGEQATGTARDNECTDNKDCGIVVFGEAQPVLEGNTCQGNYLDGIQYCEQATGTARNNECTNNKQHGIAVFGEARPVLEGNTCQGNIYCGIAYGEQATGTACDNECTNNKQSGIAVFGKAQPILEGNYCQDNGYFGIAYSEQAAGTARNNECTGNKENSIGVFDEAHPVLEGNTCQGIASNDDCFVATAAFGTPWAPEIDILRRWRDDVLRKHLAGRLFIKVYYCIGPFGALIVQKSEMLKKLVRKIIQKIIHKIQNKYNIGSNIYH